MTTQEKVMTTKGVAKRLSKLFKENKWSEAQDELFSKDAISIEPAHVAGEGMASVKGLDQIKKKGEQFNKSVEAVHGGYASEPVVAGNHIAIAMGIDATYKGKGRQKMEEIVVYEVKNGKIVKEQFFF
ncbi:MAG TPA: SnoaL-like domain-containing protein [Puia sp.]|jgi:hypothetical protein|nr:SnoaL-like domain-containing protein [Puia sp.]